MRTESWQCPQPYVPDLLGEVVTRMLESEAIQSHCLLWWTRIMTPEGVGGLPKVRQLVSDRASKRTWGSSHHTNSHFSTTWGYSPLSFKSMGWLGVGVHTRRLKLGCCSRWRDLWTKQLNAQCRPHLDTNSNKPTVKSHSGDHQISLNSYLGFDDVKNLLISLYKGNIIIT